MYYALAIGLADELFSKLKAHLLQYNLHLTVSPTLRDAGRLLSEREFHLLIADLSYLKSIRQIEWLSNVRQISFIPVVVLSDTPELDTSRMVDYGVDICISSQEPHTMIADQIHAQFRRYTKYNHYNAPDSAEVSSFRIGDISIDPPRRAVEVQGQSVELRPREFSLLLYFMKNPNVVLSSEQICSQAWGMEGSYDHGVAQPIRVLRQAIEPDPEKLIYIKTVYRAGYRFTPNDVEACEIC